MLTHAHTLSLSLSRARARSHTCPPLPPNTQSVHIPTSPSLSLSVVRARIALTAFINFVLYSFARGYMSVCEFLYTVERKAVFPSDTALSVPDQQSRFFTPTFYLLPPPLPPSPPALVPPRPSPKKQNKTVSTEPKHPSHWRGAGISLMLCEAASRGDSSSRVVCSACSPINPPGNYNHALSPKATLLLLVVCR